MSITHISAELRRQLVARAEGLCEYCLIAEEDTLFGCEADHIISEKHGGLTEIGNLAYACAFSNQAKGSDLGSWHQQMDTLVRFFNPRTDHWAEHFALQGDRLEGISAIGKVTAKIFGFNRIERLMERNILHELGRYPNKNALRRMQA